MMAFDYQMRKTGFAGNLAQIVLGLPVHLSESKFKSRVSALVQQYPILNAPLKRKFFTRVPCWETISGRSNDYPAIEVHYQEENTEKDEERGILKKKLFNRAMKPKDGEQVRFDLIYYSRGGMEIVITWVHALMDAHGAEYFLSMIGNPGIAEKAMAEISEKSFPKRNQNSIAEKNKNERKWPMAQKSFDHIDRLSLNPPVSLFSHFHHFSKSRQDYRITFFPPEETKHILNMAKNTCGLFNESAYFAASTMCDLKNLYHSKNVKSNSYVLSLPVNLRKKGTYLPVFSNQSTSLLYSFNADELLDFKTIVKHFKAQTQDAIKKDLLKANVSAMELSRFLPTWFYIKKVKQAMKGEIASLIFANPGLVYSGLSAFMEEKVDYLHHLPMIVTPPGLGVLFYQFSGKLYITLVYTEGILSREEAESFLNGIRIRLLNGR
jgi:hypothetical protein